MSYLGKGCKAVGSAGGIGDDMVLLGVVLLVVDTHDKHLSVSRWCRDDHLHIEYKICHFNLAMPFTSYKE